MTEVRGLVEKNDLIQVAFTKLHQSIRGIFPANQIEKILGFVQQVGT